MTIKEPRGNETRDTERKRIQETGHRFPGKQSIKYKGGWHPQVPHALLFPKITFLSLTISQAPTRFDPFTWHRMIG